MYIDGTLAQYITDLSAKKPAPGGGSAAALTGALGASLVLMALNFTTGKPAYKDSEEAVSAAIAELEKIKAGLLSLVDEDVAAYNKLKDAFRNTKDKNELEPFLAEASQVPLKICNLCFNAMESSSGLAYRVNKNLITDVGCGAALLESAFSAARLNVEINLDSMPEKAGTRVIRKDLEIKAKSIKKMKDGLLKDTRKIMERK